MEDWSLLGHTQRSDFLDAITMHLWEWEQGAVDAWAEAMYAKVAWEEKFANGYIKLPGNAISGKPTIDDRTRRVIPSAPRKGTSRSIACFVPESGRSGQVHDQDPAAAGEHDDPLMTR